MSTTVRHRTRGSSYHSFQDYSYTDDSDGSYTIEDISVVLDPHSNTPIPTTAEQPPTPKSFRSGIQYGGRGRRHRRPTAANDISMFRDIHSPLFLRRTLTAEKVSDSIISVDEDIGYLDDDDGDGGSLEERALDVRRLDLAAVRTDAFRRFSPRRIGVKFLSSRPSSQNSNKTSGASKTKVKSRKRNMLMKILFPNKYGCLTKELD